MFDGGGMRLVGPWTLDEVTNYLDSKAIPIRLAVLGDQGCPIVASLWFLTINSSIVCSSQKSSRIVECIERKPICGFEVAGDAPPYCGIRGQGDVVLSTQNNQEILRDLAAKYLKKKDQKLQEWLLSRTGTEVTITITPRYLASWDYRKRMGPGTS